MRQFLLGVVTGIAGLAVVGGIGAFLWANADDAVPERGDTVVAQVEAVTALDQVVAHTAIFDRRIEEVVPGVHVAIGYGLANVIVVDAPQGLILVDTLESIRAAEGLEPWINDLRATTGKEITDIVYTHNHADHVFGAGVFLRGQATVPRVWAQEATEARVNEIINVLAPVTFRRAIRMFGVYLPESNFENNGIGPRLLNDEQDGIFFLSPTDTVADTARVQMAGESVILQHAPGETDDQLVVYLPDRSVLLPADNYYHAFPNLYTIRGTPYRDPRKWAASLDLMRGFEAQVMIPQHSQPVIGAELVEERLRDYRDAIQFVYDESIRMINAGLTPNEIAHRVTLPPHLAKAPHLQEFYGRVEFAARAVFSGTLGWFSGDPADLRPVSDRREAELMADLAGGVEALAAAAQRSEPAWALVLGTHLVLLGHPAAQDIRAAALRALAEGETASSARNYYLASAAEAEGFVIPSKNFGPTPASVVNGIPIRNFMNILTVNLKASEMLDQELSYGFDFTDDAPMSIRIRRGIAFVEEGLAEDRVGTLHTTTDVFRAIAIGRLAPAKAVLSGQMSAEGGVQGLQDFLGHFARPR
ncbi:MAG: alkyl sulfatase dimerization domain-containing protein [Paracoccaceae bacterium]